MTRAVPWRVVLDDEDPGARRQSMKGSSDFGIFMSVGLWDSASYTTTRCSRSLRERALHGGDSSERGPFRVLQTRAE